MLFRSDGKVRKALQTLMAAPPRTLLNVVRKAAGDQSLTPQRIKESLIRIGWETSAGVASVEVPRRPAIVERPKRQRARKGESPYDELHHLSGKPQEVVELYRTLDRVCMSLASSAITRRYLAKHVDYYYGNRCFCCVVLQHGGLRVYVHLKFRDIENPPAFARDVSSVGHWGTGDVQLRISNRSELDAAADLIRRSFESVRQRT